MYPAFNRRILRSAGTCPILNPAIEHATLKCAVNDIAAPPPAVIQESKASHR
jgi:hypothetical protein